MNTVMESWPRRHRIKVDEYHRMAEVGLLAPDARVELIDGEIIDMAPIGTEHGSVVDLLAELLYGVVAGRGILRVQGAIRLDRASEPQPDIALLTPREDRYRSAPPGPADVLLLIEVSGTTLRYDREVKVPLYARHGIPEVWLVDLEHGELCLYRLPEGGGYLEQKATSNPGLTPVAALPGVAVDLAGLLSRPSR